MQSQLGGNVISGFDDQNEKDQWANDSQFDARKLSHVEDDPVSTQKPKQLKSKKHMNHVQKMQYLQQYQAQRAKEMSQNDLQ